jgi:hypothetical protein
MKKFILLTILLILIYGCSKSPTGSDNTPPDVPCNPNPSDGAANQPLSLYLSWTAGDVDIEHITCDVYVGTSSPPSLVAENWHNTSYHTGILESDTKYYWKIVVSDKYSTTQGPIWEFTTQEFQKPPTPKNVTITSTASGLGVIISWDPVADVDGYDVITPDGDTIDWLDYTQTTYTDASPAYTGTYEIYSVRYNIRSDPATISSSPHVSTSNATIHVLSNPTEPSGFGWDTTTGIGTVYDCTTANKNVVDFFLNDITAYFDFTSADEVPYNGDKTTHILYMGGSDFSVAPPTGYYNTENVVLGHYYAMRVQGDYYIKVHVVSATTGVNATLYYEFQIIQGFRLF